MHIDIDWNRLEKQNIKIDYLFCRKTVLIPYADEKRHI